MRLLITNNALNFDSLWKDLLREGDVLVRTVERFRKNTDVCGLYVVYMLYNWEFIVDSTDFSLLWSRWYYNSQGKCRQASIRFYCGFLMNCTSCIGLGNIKRQPEYLIRSLAHWSLILRNSIVYWRRSQLQTCPYIVRNARNQFARSKEGENSRWYLSGHRTRSSKPQYGWNSSCCFIRNARFRITIV